MVHEQVSILWQQCLAEHKVGVFKGLLYVNRSIGTPSNVVTWGKEHEEQVNRLSHYVPQRHSTPTAQYLNLFQQVIPRAQYLNFHPQQ